MGVSLIFKIAAVGILVSVLSQVLKHSGREEQAFITKPCRINFSPFLDSTVYSGNCLKSIEELFSL